MKKLALLIVPLALVAMLAVTGCGKTPGTGGTSSNAPSNEVSMSGSDFVQHAITIKAGQAVIFSDPSGSGGTHIICIGQNGACDKTLPAGAPKELASPGINFSAGDPNKSITFSTAGTYHVACTIHPAMNLTVTVQ